MTTAAGAGAGKDGCVHAWDSRSGAYSRRSTVVPCMRVSHAMHACITRAHATVTKLDAWALEWHPLGCVTRRPQTHVLTVNNGDPAWQRDGSPLTVASWLCYSNRRQVLF